MTSTAPADNDSKAEEAKKNEAPAATVGELFQYATGKDKFFIALGVLGALTNGIMFPLVSIVMGDLVSSLSQPTAEAAADATQEVSLTFLWIGLGAGAAAFMQIAFFMWAAERQSRALRSAFVRALLRQDIGWFDANDPAQLTTRISSETLKVTEGMGDKLSLLVQGVGSLLAGFTIGFVKGWQLTLVILAVFPFMACIGAALAVAMRKAEQEGQSATAEAGAVVEEALVNVRTVAAFGMQARVAAVFDSKLDEAERKAVRKSRFTGIGLGMMMFIMFACYALGLWYGSLLITEKFENSATGEPFSGGDVLAVLFGVLTGAFSLGQVGPGLEALFTARATAGKMFKLMARPLVIDSSSDEGEKPAGCTGLVRFTDVDFAYPTRPDVPIYSGLNLTLEPGATLALVGASGSGKSTVVSLLQRFYDVQAGSITLDGLPLTDLNVAWLRSQLGLVQQEPLLFACSIADNIRYGKPDATDAQVAAACKAAHISAFIEGDLPDGYDTLVGERGVQLSGGQKQRIAIARAIVRNPAILLLDEATSALDAESEALVQAALDEIMLGRTTLVIAHRLTTIAAADSIAVFEGGRIIEQGSHYDLLEADGAYAALIARQHGAAAAAGGAGAGAGTGGDSSSSDGAAADGAGDKGKPEEAKAGEKAVAGKKAAAVVKSDDKADKAGDEKEKGEDGEEEEDKDDYPAPWSRLAAFNKPEIWWGVLGVVVAGANGAVWPSFSFLFTDMLDVYYSCIAYPGPTGDMLYGVDPVWTDEEECLQDMRNRASAFSYTMLGLAFGVLAVNIVQSVIFSYMGEKLTRRVRRSALDALLKQEVAYFDEKQNSPGALSTRLSEDAGAVHSLVGTQVANGVGNLVAIGLGLGIAFYYGWELTLFVFALVPLMAIGGMIQMSAMAGSSQKGKASYEAAGSIAGAALNGIRTVAAFGAEEQVAAAFDAKLEEHAADGVRRSLLAGAGLGFSMILVFGVYFLAFFMGGHLIRTADYTADKVMKVFFGLIFSSTALSMSAQSAPTIAKAKAVLPSLFRMLDRQSAIDPTSSEGEQPAGMARGEIELTDVFFNYPSRPDVRVLAGLSLKIEPGQQVALVGPSGCGKSTVMSLLLRFYDAASGSVTLDGQEVTSLNLSWLRRQFSLVSQEPLLFNTTILENIRFGREDADDKAIRDACRDANILDFIDSLPDGMATSCGTDGTQLSGGQKQRIAIARALIRDSPVLLLDEATSALDAESEALVQETLDREMAKRTTILIAHRLSTIRNVHRIYVFESGKIVETGTHDELVDMEGLFAQLVARQEAA